MHYPRFVLLGAAACRSPLARKLIAALTLCLALGWIQAEHSRPAAAGQGNISLTIKAVGGAQSSAPVFTGIPFPPGACTDVNQIELVTNGQSVARQVKVLSSYADGSVRVALLGFKTTLAAGQSTSATVRYGYGAGVALSPQMAWTRNLGVLALCSPRWYGDSGVFGLRFLASADNTLFPAFETLMRQKYTSKSDPPSDTNPDNRNYYDHAHAVYMTMLRNGGPDSTLRRAWDEVNQYRENEIVHSGTYRGQYQAGSITGHSIPIPFNVVRRMYAQGLLDDYYFSGDDRSLAVAQEIGEAYIVDAYKQGAAFTYTERTPGFEMIGLCSLYEATLDPRYLDAARNIATIELNHQDAMATKYPNQGGISGQTGGFIQDRYGAWYDPDESSVSGAGSPFMTTVLCEGLSRLYWLTGDARTRTGILRVCDWLADAAFASNSFWYIAVDTSNGTTPSLNPMFLQMLGFAHQASGDPKYLSIAKKILAVNDWGNTIKEFNQDMHSSGQGLYLLQNAAGSVPLLLSAAGGSGGGGGVPLLPNAPTNLSATSASTSQINLVWTDNASNETGYKVERSTDGNTYAPLVTLGAGVTSYSNTGLAAATKYYYRVYAYNGAGNSGYSNVANATTGTTPPNAPGGLTATAVSSSQINLAWTDNASNESGFKVERSPDGISFTQIGTAAAGATSYSNTGLAAATKYYYRVRAYNGGGDSGYSNIANATTSGGTPPPPPPPPAGLSDDFNDNTRDPKWSFGTITGTVSAGAGAWDSAIPVLEQNQRLEISPRAGVSGIHFNGYLSAATWNVTNLGASVEVVQAAAGTSDTAFAVCIDRLNFYLMEVEAGRLYFTQVVGGARSETSITYSGTTHRFWRIRHDGATDTMQLQTSSDGTNWTTRRSLARQLSLAAMKIELGAGTWESLGSPGKAIFDNFKLQ
jgi:hypothetical protein